MPSFQDLPKELEKIIKNYKEQLEKTDIEKIAKKMLGTIAGATIVLSKHPSLYSKIAKEFALIGHDRLNKKDLTLMTGNAPKKPAKEIVKKLKVSEAEEEQMVNDVALALKGFIRTLNRTVKAQQQGQMGGGKKSHKGGSPLKSLPKELEKIVMDYKKQLESTDKKYVKNIDKLFKQYDELDSEYEETRDEDLANQRDDIYMEMEELVVKFLKAGGDFKKLQLSSNWKQTDFVKKGGAKKKRSQKGGTSLKELPKELEDMIKGYKKQFEKVDKLNEVAKKINKEWKKLEKAEKTKATGRGLMAEKLFVKINKYLKAGGNYKKLLASKKYPRSAFTQSGGAKQPAMDIESVKKATKGIELEEYEGFFDDDMGLELYDEMVEQGVGQQICRGIVTKSYLKDAFSQENVNGYIASKNGKKLGFIIYYSKGGNLYLDVVCVARDDLIKGVPLGQLLLYKMEEHAKKKGFSKMTAESLPTALPFYLKLGWKKIKALEDKYEIEKVLSKPKKASPKTAKKISPKPAAKKVKKEKTGFFGSLKKMFSRKK